jgi:hypothetical protein
MQEAMKEALRLWLRAARMPSVIALMEMVKTELATRNIVLEFAVTHRIPERGSET